MTVKKWSRLLRAAAATALFTGAPAMANPVSEAVITGQPLQYMQEGKVNGCGVRLVGLVEPLPKAKDVEGFDVSFNLYLPGAGFVKGFGFTSSMASFQSMDTQSKKRRPERLWLRANGADATTPRAGSQQQAQDPPEAILYVTNDIDEIIELFSAVMTQQILQVGMKFPGVGVERIYQGSVRMKQSEVATVARCWDELVRALEGK